MIVTNPCLSFHLYVCSGLDLNPKHIFADFIVDSSV